MSSSNPIIMNSPPPQIPPDIVRIKEFVSKTPIKILSTIQLFCAGIAAITQIVLLSSLSHREAFFYGSFIPEIGTGLWAGFFFGVTGFTGLFASHNPSKCKYTNSLVNADSFHPNFTETTFEKIPISHLTRTMKQKFLINADFFVFY